MAILIFFKAPKVRKFNYQPIYWNLEKEAMDERKKRIAQEVAIEKGEKVDYQPTIRKGFLSDKRKTMSANRSKRLSSLIFLAFIVIALIYFVLLR